MNEGVSSLVFCKSPRRGDCGGAERGDDVALDKPGVGCRRIGDDTEHKGAGRGHEAVLGVESWGHGRDVEAQVTRARGLALLV